MADQDINFEMNINAVDQREMFDKSKIIARRRMPTLELIHERFSRAVRLTLFNMIRAPIEVQMHLPVVKSYENFVNEFPERTNINIVGIRPLRGVVVGLSILAWFTSRLIICLEAKGAFPLN